MSSVTAVTVVGRRGTPPALNTPWFPFLNTPLPLQQQRLSSSPSFSHPSSSQNGHRSPRSFLCLLFNLRLIHPETIHQQIQARPHVFAPPTRARGVSAAAKRAAAGIEGAAEAAAARSGATAAQAAAGWERGGRWILLGLRTSGVGGKCAEYECWAGGGEEYAADEQYGRSERKTAV